jgi:two-component system, chemotaxis family, protein-glutamate methylesterase/glutaminase
MITSPARTNRRDIVVIGCSAGGVEALPHVLHQLPHDLQAAVFIVQHLAPIGERYLVGILARACRLNVVWAEQGAKITYGCVTVAPPDLHLMFNEEYVSLTKAARENHARPSIDKLFRSAAAVHGSRVIGVLLTGMLDDGVAGLRAIRDAGGFVIVQDPAGAAFPEMPARALLAVEPDRTLTLDAIGSAIASQVGEPIEHSRPSAHLALEAAIDHAGVTSPEQMAELGKQTTIACPDCHGPMWEIGNEQMRRYRWGTPPPRESSCPRARPRWSPRCGARSARSTTARRRSRRSRTTPRSPATTTARRNTRAEAARRGIRPSSRASSCSM